MVSQENDAHNEANVSVDRGISPDVKYVSEADISKEVKKLFNASLTGSSFLQGEYRAFEWVVPLGSLGSGYLYPTFLDLSHYRDQNQDQDQDQDQDSTKSGYNCYFFRDTYSLSNKFRTKLKKSGDAFHGITISCVDPVVDIKSVTLFMGVLLPRDKTERLGCYPDSEGDSYMFHPDRCKTLYVPVKKITNIQDKRITFAETPILFDLRMPYSIEIEYNDHLRKAFNSDFFGVSVEIYVIPDSCDRRKCFQSSAVDLSKCFTDARGRGTYLK